VVTWDAELTYRRVSGNGTRIITNPEKTELIMPPTNIIGTMLDSDPIIICCIYTQSPKPTLVGTTTNNHDLSGFEPQHATPQLNKKHC
jgi:hypothetical protein